jgi:hypothetical protein
VRGSRCGVALDEVRRGEVRRACAPPPACPRPPASFSSSSSARYGLASERAECECCGVFLRLVLATCDTATCEVTLPTDACARSTLLARLLTRQLVTHSSSSALSHVDRARQGRGSHAERSVSSIDTRSSRSSRSSRKHQTRRGKGKGRRR